MTIEVNVKDVYFEELSKLMIKYLCENHNPHTTIIITNNSAEILSGIKSVVTDEFILD
jgi:hypothetical protein